MSILVTGGAGYIGSHAVKKLIEQGCKVVVVDNMLRGNPAAIHPKAFFYKCDTRDTDTLKEIFRKENITAIMHFAALTQVPESVEHPQLYYDNNVGGTLNLIKLCHEFGVKKFIFSSTAAVYGGGDKKVNEGHVLIPGNPYGYSKLMAERIIQDSASEFDIKFVILRYFNVAGSALDGTLGCMTENATLLIKVAAEVAVGKRNELLVYGNDYPTLDGTGVRDFIHVEDLIDIHILALKYLENKGNSEILNCGYGKGYSVLQVVKAFEKIIQRTLPTKIMPRRTGDIAEIVADSSKMQRLFNWEPKCDNLDLICKSAYEWELKQSKK